jgi:hypothetical protein
MITAADAAAGVGRSLARPHQNYLLICCIGL